MTTVRRKASRLALPTALVAVSLLAVSCGGGSPSSLDPQGPVADRIAVAWWIMFGFATAVYVVVGGFIIFAVIRGRNGET